MQEKINIDGFEVEDIVREAFSIDDSADISKGITMDYNDLIDYTRYLIQLTLESVRDNIDQMNKDNKNNVFLN